MRISMLGAGLLVVCMACKGDASGEGTSLVAGRGSPAA